MYVCICAAVTEPVARECIAHGASTVDEVGDRCGAGTGCGSCRERLADMLAAWAANKSDVVLTGDLAA